MRKSVLVVGACALMGGCALPVPIQVASWAIDLITIASTEKSVADHGLSALTDKDCALHRAVTEDDNVICRDVDDRKDVMTADAGTPAKKALSEPSEGTRAPRFDAVEAQVAAADPVEPPASFATADGEQPVAVSIDLAALQPVAEEVDRPFIRFTETAAVRETSPARKTRTTAVAPVSTIDAKPQAGFYYVIGSFRDSDRAKRHMQTYSSLEPAVLHGKIGRDERDVYRVVVGPFNGQERSVAFRRIKRTGIADTWAIRVSPQDWAVAARTRPTQQANAGATLGARNWPGLVHFIAAR